MAVTIYPPFGSYALSPQREAWRQKASKQKDTRLGRLFISHARKKALASESGPFDVTVMDGVLARLYPSGNRCEKRAFAGVQVWDAAERTALKRAIEGTDDLPFIFLDVGANVGLYSLIVNAYAKAANKAARIIAIEPALEICARLETNIAVNEADIQIIRAAVSNQPGMGYLGGGEINRGETRLSPQKEGREAVVMDTLPRIARMLGLKRIDAMKVDIEGHDFPALKTFFADAPRSLHPIMLIIETGRSDYQALLELCQSQSYLVAEYTKSNAILSKER